MFLKEIFFSRGVLQILADTSDISRTSMTEASETGLPETFGLSGG